MTDRYLPESFAALLRDVKFAARSLALPFFPGLAEGQIARVAEALRSALGR